MTWEGPLFMVNMSDGDVDSLGSNRDFQFITATDTCTTKIPSKLIGTINFNKINWIYKFIGVPPILIFILQVPLHSSP